MTLTVESIAELYDAEAANLLRYLVRRTLDPDAAVDLLAATFAHVVADRRKFRGATKEEAISWAYAIARNQLATYLRRGKLERAALERVGWSQRDLSSYEYDRIESLIDLASLSDEIHEAVAALPQTQRDVIHLRVIEERSYNELAQLLGISEQTARMRGSRALRALRTNRVLCDLETRITHV